MTTSTTHGDDGRKGRKRLVGIAAIATAGALVAGLGFAFFSDSLTFGGSATAGTLDLRTTGLDVYQNGVKDDDGVIDNLNPGDVIDVKGTVTNAGSKSAWVRSVIDVKAGSAIGQYLYVYADGADQATLLAGGPGAGGGVLVNSGLTGQPSEVVVLNGTGDGAEVETTPELGVGQVDVDMTVYFAKEALNVAQGETVTVSGTVQALQYRNNPSPDWNGTIETLAP